MKAIAFAAIALLAIALILEIGLRWILGFGRPPLYVSDPKTGYRLAPDQQLRRFGNRITINTHSMRGPALLPDGTTLRVLVLGDSIANGGWWTDNAETIPAQLGQQLLAQLPQPLPLGLRPQNLNPEGPIVEVLNASANSWGPRNELGYLESFGSFNASAIVLLLNTDDLFATAPSTLQVGRDPNYPDSPPPLALVELYELFVPPPRPPELAGLGNEPGDRVGNNLKAIAQTATLANASGAVFLLALTPLKREVVPPGPRDYEQKARDRLKDLTQSLEIPCVDFLPAFRTVGNADSLYRDSIHLSPAGNALVSNTLARRLQDLLLAGQVSP